MQAKSPRGGRRPDRHPTVNSALNVRDVPRLVGFPARTFDAVEIQRMVHPDDEIIQAEVTKKSN